MKRNIFLNILWIFIITAFGYGAFEDGVRNARSRAMGDAIFADFDGVNSMNYNPATIALARSIQIYGSWDTPYMGLDDDTGINTLHFDAAIPFWSGFSIGGDPFVTKRAAIGLSFKRLSVSGKDANGANVEFYHEGIYSFIYAKDLNDVISKGAKISAGIKLNLYDIGIGNTIDVQSNPNIARLGNISFGMDAGLTYDFSESIRLGLFYRNIIAPNISILPDGTDILPSELGIGGNWNIGDLWIFKKSKLGFGLVTYGRDPNDNRQSDSTWHLGYEFRQLTATEIMKGSTFTGEMLAFRFGVIYLQKKLGEEIDMLITKLKGEFNLTGGIGFTYGFDANNLLTIDYCIEYGLNMGALKHIAGLTYSYAFPNSAFVYDEAERKKMEEEEKAREKKLREQANVQQTNITPATLPPSVPVNVPKKPARK